MEESRILAVMGVTGAGKSSFIKLVTGNTAIKIGHGQSAETKSINSYKVNIRGCNFTLVDTPGFDDEDLSDSDILRMLIDWLASSYRRGQKLSGILYLHRISDTRMRGSSLRNLGMFKELIGDSFYKNVTLATSCWSLVPHSVALEREIELKTNTNFWKNMLAHGAQLERISASVADAQALVHKAASHDAAALQAQRDVVDLGTSFADLRVTKMVNYETEKLKKELENERQRLVESLARAQRAVRQRVTELREQNERVQAALRRTQLCSRNSPFGTCDRRYCNNKLKRYKVTWHCCSCYPLKDNYWHCGPCGNDCGNDEHPFMSRIENDDDCLVM